MIRVLLYALLATAVCGQLAGSWVTWTAKALGIGLYKPVVRAPEPVVRDPEPFFRDPEHGVRDTECCQAQPDWGSAVSLSCECSQHRDRTEVSFSHDQGSIVPNWFRISLIFPLLLNVFHACSFAVTSCMYGANWQCCRYEHYCRYCSSDCH